MCYSKTCLSSISPLAPQNEEQALVLWVWHHRDHISHLQETQRMHRSRGESQSYQGCLSPKHNARVVTESDWLCNWRNISVNTQEYTVFDTKKVKYETSCVHIFCQFADRLLSDGLLSCFSKKRRRNLQQSAFLILMRWAIHSTSWD